MSTLHPRARSSALPLLVIVAAGLATGAWASAAMLMSGRGLDLTDESFYLLSYRWWDSTPRAFSGVQYLYGPVFQLLGYDVAALRIFRLATVLASHAVFAWAFVAWILAVRPDSMDRRRAWAGGLMILTSAGIVYGWLPQSPGYNDVALLGSLLLLSAVLRSASAVVVQGRLPLLPAVAAGPVVLALVLAKWASAGLIVVSLLLVLLFLVGLRGVGWPRFLGIATVSMALSSAAFHILLMPWGDLLPPMLEVNRIAAEGTNSPAALLAMYLREGTVVLGWALLLCMPAVVLLALARWTRSTQPIVSGALAFLAPFTGLAVVAGDRWGVIGGGTALIDQYTAALMAPCLLVAVAGMLEFIRRTDGVTSGNREWPVIAALALLPVVQAVGTGNGVHVLAVNQFACWMAVLVWCAATMPLPMVRPLVWGSAATAAFVVTSTAVSGLLVHPYRTAGFEAATERVGGAGALSDLRVSHDERRLIDQVRTTVGGTTSGAPVLVFDELAGLVLALDGRSVGEAWYSAIDRDRTGKGIRAACASGELTAAPVLIFSRPVRESDLDALRACGQELAGFQRIAVSTPRPLVYYIPLRGEVSR